MSPDGTRLVYAANVAGTQQLYLRRFDELDAQPIAGTENAYEPFFSPDGEWVGFFDTVFGDLKRVSVRGGQALDLCDCFPPEGATWLPDGTIVTTHGEAALVRIPEAGGTPEPLTTLDAERGEVAHSWPRQLPGGKALLFTITRDLTRTDASEVAVLSLDSGEYHTVIDGGYNARYVSTGHLVFGRQGALWGVPFDVDRLATTGREEVVLQDVELNEEYGSMALAVSADGSLVYMRGTAVGSGTIGFSFVWVDRDGGEEPVPLPLRLYQDPSVSPDGGRLAVSVVDIETRLADIWAYDLATGAGLRLTQEGDNQLARWTPDGERVLFSRVESPNVRNLYRVRADGSGAAERLTTSEEDQGLISISPDGQTVIYTRIIDSVTWDIMSALLGGDAEPQPVVTGPFRQGSGELSPDGRWLAYRSDEAGEFEIYLQPYPGPGPKTPVSIGGGKWPMWAPDGRAVFYENDGSLMMRTIETEPAVRLGSPEVVFDLGGYELGAEGQRRQFNVAADGERFLLLQPQIDGQLDADAPPPRLTVVLNWFEELKRLVPVP